LDIHALEPLWLRYFDYTYLDIVLLIKRTKTDSVQVTQWKAIQQLYCLKVKPEVYYGLKMNWIGSIVHRQGTLFDNRPAKAEPILDIYRILSSCYGVPAGSDLRTG
jgi:NAD(P)H-nitrite reductase large subunit